MRGIVVMLFVLTSVLAAMAKLDDGWLFVTIVVFYGVSYFLAAYTDRKIYKIVELLEKKNG